MGNLANEPIIQNALDASSSHRQDWCATVFIKFRRRKKEESQSEERKKKEAGIFISSEFSNNYFIRHGNIYINLCLQFLLM